MAANPESVTSPTLLGQLRQAPANQEAWGEFVERYGRRIYGWCRHWSLQDADARDVTQTVLLKLADKMNTFVYDPSGSFRSWLKTLTRHALSDFLASRQRSEAAAGGSGFLETLQAVEARDDLVAKLEAEFDNEILVAATRLVQQRVDPNTWEAFRLTAQEALSGAAAAAQLHMQVAAVFKAKSRVQKMLRDEVRSLEGS